MGCVKSKQAEASLAREHRGDKTTAERAAAAVPSVAAAVSANDKAVAGVTGAQEVADPAQPELETKQPPFSDEMYHFLEANGLSMLGVMLLCSSGPEAMAMRGVLTETSGFVQSVEVCAIGRPWTLRLSALCLDVLALLQTMEGCDLQEHKSAIGMLRSAIGAARRHSVKWMQNGWLVEFGRGCLMPELLTQTHTQILKAAECLKLDVHLLSAAHPSHVHEDCAHGLVRALVDAGQGDMLAGCRRLLGSTAGQALLAQKTGVPYESISAGLDHPMLMAGAEGAEAQPDPEATEEPGPAMGLSWLEDELVAGSILGEESVMDTSLLNQTGAAGMLDTSLMQSQTGWAVRSETSCVFESSLTGAQASASSGSQLDASPVRGADVYRDRSADLSAAFTFPPGLDSHLVDFSASPSSGSNLSPLAPHRSPPRPRDRPDTALLPFSHRLSPANSAAPSDDVSSLLSEPGPRIATGRLQGLRGPARRPPSRAFPGGVSVVVSTVQPTPLGGEKPAGKLVGVPLLPQPYLHREELLHKAMGLLIAQGSLVISGAGGAPGRGCSTLAAAVCRSVTAGQLCPDGMFWLPLLTLKATGRCPEYTLMEHLWQMFAATFPELCAVTAEEMCHQRTYASSDAQGRLHLLLSAVLSQKLCLLVIDGVDRPGMLASVQGLGWCCKILTTDSPPSSSWDASSLVVVPGLTPREAAAMPLLPGQDQTVPRPIPTETIEACGASPLAHRILRRVVGMADGTGRSPDVLEAFLSTMPADGAQDVGLSRVLRWCASSGGLLGGQRALERLAVVPPSAAAGLPVPLLMAIWDLDPEEVVERVAAMERLGVLLRLETFAGVPQVDIPRELLAEQVATADPGELEGWHGALVDVLMPHAGMHWMAGASVMERYAGAFLAHHLLAAGRKPELRGLLFNSMWLEWMVTYHGLDAAMAAWQGYLQVAPGDAEAEAWEAMFHCCALDFQRHPRPGALVAAMATQTSRPTVGSRPGAPEATRAGPSTVGPVTPRAQEFLVPVATPSTVMRPSEDASEDLELMDNSLLGENPLYDDLMVVRVSREDLKATTSSSVVGRYSVNDDSPASDLAAGKAKGMLSPLSMRQFHEVCGGRCSTSSLSSTVDLPMCETSSSPPMMSTPRQNVSPELSPYSGPMSMLSALADGLNSLPGQAARMSSQQPGQPPSPQPLDPKPPPEQEAPAQASAADLYHCRAIADSKMAGDGAPTKTAAAGQLYHSTSMVPGLAPACQRGQTVQRALDFTAVADLAQAPPPAVAVSSGRAHPDDWGPSPEARRAQESSSTQHMDNPLFRSATEPLRAEGLVDDDPNLESCSTSQGGASFGSSVEYVRRPAPTTPRGGGGGGVVIDTAGLQLVRVGDDNSRVVLDLSSPRPSALPWGSNPTTPRTGAGTGGTSARARAVTASGDRAVMIDENGRQAVWDLASGVKLFDLEGGEGDGCGPDGQCRGVTVASADSVVLMPATPNGPVRVFNTHTGACQQELSPSKSERVRGIAVSADGHRVVAVDSSQEALVYDTEMGALLTRKGIEPEEVKGVTSSSDGTRIVTVSSKGIARLWDMATKTCLYEMGGKGTWHGGLAVDADGVLGVALSENGKAQVWDLEANVCIQELCGTIGPRVKGVALAPDGRSAVTVDDSGEAFYSFPSHS